MKMHQHYFLKIVMHYQRHISKSNANAFALLFGQQLVERSGADGIYISSESAKHQMP